MVPDLSGHPVDEFFTGARLGGPVAGCSVRLIDSLSSSKHSPAVAFTRRCASLKLAGSRGWSAAESSGLHSKPLLFECLDCAPVLHPEVLSLLAFRKICAIILVVYSDSLPL